MKIFISKYNGFCSGVKIAVDKANKTLDAEKKLYSYGEIIHNKDVIDELSHKGLKVVDCVPDESDAKLLIRAHGVGKQIIDELNEKNVDFIDATCVKVKNIHKIVEECKNNGYNIIITGDKNHPEVLGILGWCNNEATIISTVDEFLNIEIDFNEKYCLVSQTTFNTETFQKIVDLIGEKKYLNIEIHNTICTATRKRQEAILELASKCNVMLIVGSSTSSNTKKLYELSKKICPGTFLIENYKEIPYNYIDKNTIVGVSAGASAPDRIIEEVINMLENLNNNMNEQVEKNEQENAGSMRELFENYGGVSYIRTGERVKGTVIYVSPEAISVNINYKSDGIITRDEYSLSEVTDLTEVVKEGDEIEAQVMRVSDQDGNVVLTRKPLEESKIWNELEKMKDENTVVETTIIEASQYGIYGKVKGIKGFIPRNQISIKRNVDTSEYVGKVLKVNVLETKNNKGRRQLVLTSRAVEKIEKEIKDKEAWENIKEGEIYEGVVKNIQDYGAFVEIDGIDGLLHINEIAWTRIKHPSEVLKTGDKISVKVKSVDKENRKLSLSYKATVKSPWSLFLDKHQKGDVVTGKVSRIVDFGAFVDIDGIECLLHIKDLDWARTEKVTDVLQEGQEVTAKILNITRKDRKVSLGLKQLTEHPFDVYTKNIKKDDIIPVEVTRILLDGVHVSVNGNIDSFIPIARVSTEKLRTPAQVVKVGEVKDAKVLGIDSKGKNLSLTFVLEDKGDEASNNDNVSTYIPEESNFTIGESIGDALEDLLNNN
ncbi:4-hydroxy-3-methylbut-2-enyl diphosphate reductase [Sedimentibacter sp.]|uniref:4-hydroxy-3-methylbut-2-enyl diphosphate reductase n=1 Tax=Sedimentibacter sp. TaxID=1960295 RepID=UPI0028A0A157|nr:4-hydroxy-3-methylbut-2-enyl diphosphate reductase [Sedimentibacter sp.]